MFGSKTTTVEAPTVIGQGAVIEGTVRAEGRVQVDGEVEGTLEVRGHVSVGPKGKVRGELVADDIAVGGEVEGRIIARQHLHVVSSGIVRGDVRYATLQIDRGAVLDGRTVHGDELGADIEVVEAPADGAAKASGATSASDDARAAKPPPAPPPAVGSRKAPAPVGAS